MRGLLALNLVVASATALVVVNTVVYVRDLLGGSSSGVAIALAFYGGGSMIVALTVPRILTTISDRTLMLTGAAVVVVGIAAACVFVASTPTALPGWVALSAIWAIMGTGTSMINTPSARVLRRESDESSRTAIFTAQFSLSHAGFLLTYPLAGWFGAEISQFAAAATLVVIATLAALTATRLWARTSTTAASPT